MGRSGPHHPTADNLSGVTVGDGQQLARIHERVGRSRRGRWTRWEEPFTRSFGPNWLATLPDITEDPAQCRGHIEFASGKPCMHLEIESQSAHLVPAVSFLHDMVGSGFSVSLMMVASVACQSLAIRVTPFRGSRPASPSPALASARTLRCGQTGLLSSGLRAKSLFVDGRMLQVWCEGGPRRSFSAADEAWNNNSITGQKFQSTS